MFKMDSQQKVFKNDCIFNMDLKTQWLADRTPTNDLRKFFDRANGKHALLGLLALQFPSVLRLLSLQFLSALALAESARYLPAEC